MEAATASAARTRITCCHFYREVEVERGWKLQGWVPLAAGPRTLGQPRGQSGSRDTALAKHTQDVKEGREG